MTKQPDVRAPGTPPAPIRQTVAASPLTPDDRFFRHIVDSMRNGVIAIRRNGNVALMNEEAYRIFGLEQRKDDLGRPLTALLRDRPDVIRVLAGSFELSHLPNRAEMRLKDLDRVIGADHSLRQIVGLD